LRLPRLLSVHTSRPPAICCCLHPLRVYACPQRSGLHRQVCPLLHPLEHHLDLRIQQLGEQLHAQRFEVLILYVHAPMQLLQELVRGLTAADAAEQDRRRGVAGELAK